MPDVVTYKVAYDHYECLLKPPSRDEILKAVMHWQDTHSFMRGAELSLEGAEWLVRRLWPQLPKEVVVLRVARET